MNKPILESKVNLLVSFSGGKDSQATLIWVVKKFGNKNVKAVFCDTGHENPKTYEHVKSVCEQLEVELVILKNTKYDSLYDMAKKRGRFPSTMARFCTEQLKIVPMVDYVLTLEGFTYVFQGIRKDESYNRRNMDENCKFFKGWTEPYSVKDGKERYNTYRKKDVLKWLETNAAEIFRPVLDWTAQEVINYILENGQKPNPLYYQGFSRVGCFPCIMATHKEVKRLIDVYPESWEGLKQAEQDMPKKDRHFFPPNYLPKHACSNKKYPYAEDVEKYLAGKDETMELFEEQGDSSRCMSHYHLCE